MIHSAFCSSRPRVLVALVAILAPGTVWAQRYRFKYYSHGDGLKETEVHSLIQDRTGFLWVGTSNALFRYDGADFVEYQSGDAASDFIEALAETPDGTLWAGTQNGLARMHNGRLEFADPPGRVKVSGQSSLAVDAQGRLYAGTSDGLYAGEPEGGSFRF